MEIIHIVLGKANPNRLNGVNKVVYNMATEQVLAGKDIQVWGITSNLQHDYPSRNFKTKLFKAHKNPFSIDSALKKEILQHRDAVFHIHGGWVPRFSGLGRFFTKHAIKYVITPHGAYNAIAMKRSHFTKRVYFQLFEKRLIQGARKVHSIGQSEVDGLKVLYPKAASFLLPYGFNYQNETVNTSKNNQFTIGFVGRLDVYTKGLDLLMEAFYQFQRQYKDAQLWVVGSGAGKDYLENFIQEHQLKNVTLWGKKFGQEKDELISKMHVFCHPSRNEGLPTAVLEAASLGTAVVVSRATNIAQYVQEYKAGISIENEQVEALTSAMETLYKAYWEGSYGAYQAGGKKMLTEVFSWQTLVNKFDHLYHE